ncbi:hypothetical protein PR048_027109 [Dryococelus australis]|uniref:Uncharacterized protein n=1 Tax=Dryococelus australis TaxID=614101 RepID=A0ABQ9GEI8_9NEOP|nr:hypothetical protein PR048_027109 [Dryococelus australis]
MEQRREWREGNGRSPRKLADMQHRPGTIPTCENPWIDPARNQTRIALVGDERSTNSNTVAPLFSGFSRFPTLHSKRCSPYSILHRIARRYIFKTRPNFSTQLKKYFQLRAVKSGFLLLGCTKANEERRNAGIKRLFRTRVATRGLNLTSPSIPTPLITSSWTDQPLRFAPRAEATSRTHEAGKARGFVDGWTRCLAGIEARASLALLSTAPTGTSPSSPWPREGGGEQDGGNLPGTGKESAQYSQVGYRITKNLSSEDSKTRKFRKSVADAVRMFPGISHASDGEVVVHWEFPALPMHLWELWIRRRRGNLQLTSPPHVIQSPCRAHGSEVALHRKEGPHCCCS